MRVQFLLLILFFTPTWPVIALATFLNHYSLTFMSRLSSTTLFHFTHEFDTLVKILEEGLWPRYCVERDWGDKDLIIPMVCTCDIPLSKMSFHQNKYGKYGIGLKKKWAKDKGFTPVLYVSDKSDIYNRLTKYAKHKLIQPVICHRDSFDEEYMLHYVKRAVGTDADREHLKLGYKPKFINEREWRYVPFNVPMSFANKGKGQDIDCTRLSELTKDKKLKLEPDGIAYIIVEQEEERTKIIQEIQRVFKDKESECINWLISQVCSSEQMKEDY